MEYYCKYVFKNGEDKGIRCCTRIYKNTITNDLCSVHRWSIQKILNDIDDILQELDVLIDNVIDDLGKYKKYDNEIYDIDVYDNDLYFCETIHDTLRSFD